MVSAHVVTQFHARPGRGDDVESLLREPLIMNYCDEVFYSPGLAASPSVPPAGARPLKVRGLVHHRVPQPPRYGPVQPGSALFCDQATSSPAWSGRLRVFPAGASGHAQAGS
jgi:hypothetical protein